MKNLIIENKKFSLDPWYIVGFVDAEGSFGLSLAKDFKRKLGVILNPKFTIGVHINDMNLLQEIKNNFNVRKIYITGNLIRWQISSIKDLTEVIIPFFDKYQLVSKKQADYKLFKKIIELINNKEHMTSEGLQKIINIKASLNKGNYDKLKIDYPNTVPEDRPEVEYNGIPDPNWIAGFTDGDGCFFIRVYNSPKSKLGKAVQLSFIVTQHIRDKELLKSFIEYFNCGQISERKDACDFIVVSITDINKKIIPFFFQYKLQGIKKLNLADFSQVAKIMETKEHLTHEGLNKIIKIKAGMNTRRSDI